MGTIWVLLSYIFIPVFDAKTLPTRPVTHAPINPPPLDSEGNVITGSGVQIKFYETDSFVDFVSGKKRGKHGKLWVDKYSDGKFSVPSDHYDEIKGKLKDEIENLESSGNLTAEQQRRLDYIKKVDKNLQKSKVSKSEAVDTRKNPEKVTTKEIAKTSHEAGLEAAKVGVAVGGGISVITNTISVLKGDKEPGEAVLDVTKDTAVAGATSYATGFANTALASVMKNSTNELVRSLGKANAPAYIIQTAISTTKSLGRLCSGKITVNEFFLEIGKNGMALLASVQGAVVGGVTAGAIGATGIAATVVAPLVGGLVGALVCGVIYDYTIGMRILNEEIYEFTNQLNIEIALLKKYHARLLSLDLDEYRRDTQKYAVVADFLDGEHSKQDFNTMLRATYAYMDIPCPWGDSTFDDFMNDRERVLTFG